MKEYGKYTEKNDSSKIIIIMEEYSSLTLYQKEHSFRLMSGVKY